MAVFSGGRSDNPTGILKALQLTNKFDSFKTIGKQSGFLFYVSAWNTSKIDPTTGFVNLFDTTYKNLDDAKTFFSRFDRISYNDKNKYFEFEFDYNNGFTKRAEGTKSNWTLCTHGQRIYTYKNFKTNYWEYKEVDLNKEFKDFFISAKIDFESGANVKSQIINKEDANFYKELLRLLKLTLQMRNSMPLKSLDYLVSPVMNSKGEFFDTRKAPDYLPCDADANGAYNIARKGLWVINQIKKAPDVSKIEMVISHKDWLNFVQQYG